jgi:predicted nucleic acid-binding protein
MPDVLVVNASPLIFLGNAGQIDLLRFAGASRITVPQTVFDEVTTTMHDDAAVRSVTESGWLERTASIEIPVSVIEWDLGPGESSVIALALAIAGARPIIDDLAGRKCALALGLNVSGTLGIVVAAYRRGQVKDLRKVMMNLRSAGMWLSDAVVENALRLAHLPPSP